MDYELRIVVEKVAVRSQEVVQRDTIKCYGIQRPASIVDFGLWHAEQIVISIQHRGGRVSNARIGLGQLSEITTW